MKSSHLNSGDQEDLLWGIDLGGTKIEIVACSIDHNSEGKTVTTHLRKRVSTPVDHNYNSIIECIGTLCKDSMKELDTNIKSIGLGHPGSINPDSGTMRNANTTSLNGRQVYKDLDELFSSIGIHKTKYDNDANCFALAEHSLGEGKDYASCFGVILGTGVGGGLCRHKENISGAYHLAGEWGHLSVWDNGPPCYCGKRGCIETLISGPALEHYYFLLNKKKMSLEAIMQELHHDVAARMVYHRLLYWLSRGLSSVVNIYDPACIILGGGVSSIPFLYEDLPPLLSPWVFTDDFQTPIIRASLGDSAGVFGAALL